MRKHKKRLHRHKYKILIIAALALIILLLNIVPIKEAGENICFEDGYCIVAEIRDTPETRTSGLMFRESLEENKGMLFIFENSDRYTFWMKNMKIPIDIIFISEDKKIINIHKNAQPCTVADDQCQLYPADSDSLYVIETKAGFSERHGLAAGQNVELLV